MSTKGTFNHSVSVPRIYKVASKVAKNAKNGQSLKNLVYQEKHVNIKAVYALVVETFKREAVIEELIEKSQLFLKEPRFDPWLAKILICEMLWGKNKMKGDSKPIQTIFEYEKVLKKILSNDCNDVTRDVLKHNVMKPRYARVNTLKISVEEAVNNFRDEGWTLVKYFNNSNYDEFLEKLNNLESNEFMIDIHIPELLIFPPKTEFYKHEAYKSKSIILQDKASCLPVFLLDPIPGSTVIDMCAAPGMKTTQAAAMIKNSGTVHAVELDIKREKVLREVVEAAGATCVKTILKDVMQVTDTDCPGVEYILVDPSCTGSGITDRVEIEDQNFHDRVSRLKKLCNFQAKLLRHATTAFPQAKRIVYSTCSINAEENEDVVRQILETCKNFKLIDAKKLLKSWNDKSSEVFPALGKMCVYATPEKDKSNGFFIAVLERLNEGEKNPYLNVQLCKLYDRGKQTKRIHSQESGKENSEDIDLQQTNQATYVPPAKKKIKKDEITNKNKLYNENKIVNHVSQKVASNHQRQKLSDDVNSNNLNEPVKILKNKFKQSVQENISEQVTNNNKKKKITPEESPETLGIEQLDATGMSTELNESNVSNNEKVKKKKKKKIAPEEPLESIEIEQLDGTEMPAEFDESNVNNNEKVKNKKKKKITPEEPLETIEIEELDDTEMPTELNESNVNNNEKVKKKKKKVAHEEPFDTLETEHLYDTEMPTELDESNINNNEKVKKKKKKKIAPEEPLGTLETEPLDDTKMPTELDESNVHNEKVKKKKKKKITPEESSEILETEAVDNTKKKTELDKKNVNDEGAEKKKKKITPVESLETEQMDNTRTPIVLESNVDHNKTVEKKKKKKITSEESLKTLETEQLDNTRIPTQLDENNINNNEKVEKKKKKKITPEESSVTLETEHPEGNYKYLCNESIKDESKETLTDCLLAETSTAKRKKKNHSPIDTENLNLTNSDCENVKLKTSKRKLIDELSENIPENEVRNKEVLMVNSIPPEISQKKKTKKYFEGNENHDITMQECDNVKLKSSKRRKGSSVLSEEPGNKFEHDDNSGTPSNRKKKHSKINDVESDESLLNISPIKEIGPKEENENMIRRTKKCKKTKKQADVTDE